MEKILNNYLDNLARNPERLDSLLMFTGCTLITWLIVLRLRDKFLPGLAGDGKHPGDTSPDNLDAREQILFIFYFIGPTSIWYVLFFKKLDMWQFVAMWAALAPFHTTTGFQDTDKTGAVVGNQSLAITNQGFVVKESGGIVINGIAPGDAVNPRIDIVVMTHAYSEIGGGSQALYSIIQGTPAGSPVAPALATPATQIRIGQLYVPANMLFLDAGGVVWTRDTAGVNYAIVSRNVDASKIGTGVVSNTEFSYLDGVTSAIQTQINSKQDSITGAANFI